MMSSALWQLIWFVVAGFLLGFVLSTLWEWIFFRRERVNLRDRRIAELESELQLLRHELEVRREIGQRPQAPREYRSPGVFLESEQAEELADLDVQPAAAGILQARTQTAGEQTGTYHMPPPAVTERSEADPRVAGPSGQEQRTAAHATEDPQTEDPRAEDPRTEDPRTEDPRTEDSRTEDPQTEDPKTEDPKAEESERAQSAREGGRPSDAQFQPGRSAELRAELMTRAAELSTPRPPLPERAEGAMSLPEGSLADDGERQPDPSDAAFQADHGAIHTSQPAPDEYEPFDDEPVEPFAASAPPSAQATVAVVRPDAIDRPRLEHPDNLSRIKGIGKVYMRRLYAAGIYTWHQVGQCGVEELREIVDPPVSANVEEWPAQGRALAQRFDRVGATYVGPRPDDLTSIRGIGSSSAQALYQAGICTYTQLASTSTADLAVVIPSSPSGDEIDYAAWIRSATRLIADDPQ